MRKLEGKVAIVTGSSNGIGMGIAKMFAAEGAKVVLAARRKAELEKVAKEIKDKGGEAMPYPGDITKEPHVQAMFKKTHDSYGRIDILVNNAGVAVHTPTEDITLEYWQSVVDINLTAVFLCSREAIRYMKKQGGGRIVNMGSISAIVPRRHSIAYAATKSAIEGLTHSLTLDGRDYGVVASYIHPGSTSSGFNASRGGPGPGKTPADYIMHQEDVANIALLMCSLPPEVNLFNATILPNHMKSFIDRG
jgi:NAD(P)-dependent dehydrogenase (short-subunit alcohol dehydrogenase family)